MYKFELGFSRHLFDRIFSLSCLTLSLVGFAIEKFRRKTTTSIFRSLTTIMCVNSFLDIGRVASVESRIRTLKYVCIVRHIIRIIIYTKINFV